MFSPLPHLARLGRAVAEWPVASQQHSRRNAMIALTACADRRAEREEVAAYLAERRAQPEEATSLATVEHEVAVRA
ncbi:hypothetical protein [Nocardioides pelophilus]|uniref:hypothetical protein n=1 Tax=Nocardioides pelophilus TaxID=2172019 RepID=UPI001600FB9C|nr:hypothetical protein [Nocardioides pelophilus]